MFGEQFTSVALDEKKTAGYERNIMENGTPSREELILELRNFFEGPINLDLMLLGLIKNMGNDTKKSGKYFPPKEVRQQASQGLTAGVLIPQQVIQYLQMGYIDAAHRILINAVQPNIKKICLNESSL